MKKLSIMTPVYNQEDLVILMLDHIPRRDDLEVIVRDDGSTDATLERLLAYKDAHPELNLTVRANGENKGVAYTKNRLLEEVTGEWVHIHDSDDYAITEVYNMIINDWLYGQTDADIVCMDLELTDRSRLAINEASQRMNCAQIARFIRRDLIGDTRFPEHIRAGDDWYFAEDLIAKNPRIVYTGFMAYHYNFPRVGSLSYLQRNGMI